jgi:hypothetical protein
MNSFFNLGYKMASMLKDAKVVSTSAVSGIDQKRPQNLSRTGFQVKTVPPPPGGAALPATINTVGVRT